ncbi:MAG TPA: hypothetical protein VM639_08340 [Dongiaceae bacterium]|nr:hypothetical protein [Dongiaceae bacterium]
MLALILSACATPEQPAKSDLQQAAQAAKIAGEAEANKRTAPLELVPSKPAKAKVAVSPPPVIQPSIVPASAATASTAAPARAAAPVAAPAAAGKADLVAAAKPIAAGPVVAPSPAAGTDDPAVASKLPVNGTAIHLASYREIGSAQRGWQILTRSYRELQPLKPLYVAVDLPGKGRVLRLYGTGADAAALKAICDAMHTDGAYCAANIAF